ncbi:MAG: LpqB family beta-propeller domain-containing protein [Brachybacterium sp.]|nr:LpqB family beta-propeller domain-containing protein [Brachybacterium sp.]
MNGTGRRRFLALGFTATVGGVSACARIPTASDVQSTPLGGTTEQSVPYVRPLPPADGATPAQIVAGFVQAGVGPEEDYAIAREHLTPEAAADWDPYLGVTVYSAESEPTIEQQGDASVRLELQALAQVAPDGTRTVLANPSNRGIDIALAEVDGQWRIAQPPPGIFLSDAAFGILFQPAVLHFLDGSEQFLVPDVRWYSSHDVAASVMHALAAEPATVLRQAVHSAVPSDLAIGGIGDRSQQSGPTRIDLPAAVGELPAARRHLALAQLGATLQSLPGLGTVTLTIDGETPPTPTNPPVPPRPGHRPFGATTDGVIALTETVPTGDPSPLVPAFTGRMVSAPVLHAGVQRAAALDEDPATVLIAPLDEGENLREVDLEEPAVGPAIDPHGYVWTSPRSADGTLRALATDPPIGDTEDTSVPCAWIRGRQVRRLALSSDGTRLVILSASRGPGRLDLCAIQRADDGSPQRIGDPMPLSLDVAEVLDVCWYDATSLLVLSRVSLGDDAVQVQIVDDIGGLESLPAPAAGVVSLAGSSVSSALWAARADGALFRFDGSSWSEIDLPVRDPRFY